MYNYVKIYNYVKMWNSRKDTDYLSHLKLIYAFL